MGNNQKTTFVPRSRITQLLLVIGLPIAIVAGTMLAFDLWGIALAAAPIDGNPISMEGPTSSYSTSQAVLRAVVAADLDNDGYPDVAFGQANTLAIQPNVGVTITQWGQTVTVGSLAYDLRDVCVVDLDRDGAIDLVSASADDSGNSQLCLWRNPTLPFTNSWTVSNTLATSAISLTTVAAADLDRNGTPDLVSGGLDGVLRLWDNPLTGTQSFATSWSSPAAITTTDQIQQVLIADVDRDGSPDIIKAAGDGSSGVLRLWQNPDDPFNTAWTISNTLETFTTTVSSIALGDLDNDGALDVVAGLADGQVVAWRNPLTGTQSFTTDWGTSSTIGGIALPVEGLVLTDADHDGLLDVVAAGSGVSSTLTAWHNTGQPFSGGWSSVSVGTVSDAVFALTASDFNRDGDTDFITAGGNTGTNTGNMQFWTNALIRSAPRFETPSVSNSTANPLSGVGLHAMDMHDMDRDGLPDIVVATLSGTLMLARNDGTPFSSGDWPIVTIGSAPSFFSVIVGDLDGDGWPDIATSTALTATGNHVHIWHNDGTPFSGTWISQTAGTFPRQVMDLALGDVGREGGLQIIAATGITTTFNHHGERDVITSTNNRIWLMRPPASNPFASAWISSTVCTTTYSANGIALGDLDNDGWMDVVFATDHAPSAGSNPDDWPDAYQVRACRSLGNPYLPSGWQDYDIGRDDSPVSIVAGNHQFWGAHAWGVAVGDLDNDGYPDVVSGGGAEGDYQVLVYKNDGTPFNSGHWEPTAVGYGTRFESGTSCPTVPGTYPGDCPWLETSVPAVSLGDLNGNGMLDIVSGFGRAYTYMPLWLNTGVPFGETVTDTHWIRYNINGVASRPVYGVEAVDLDQDGRLDVAAVTSWWPESTPASGPLRVWRNLGGIARHKFQDRSLSAIEDGASEHWFSFSVKNNGRSYDHDLEPVSLNVRMTYGAGLMDNAEAAGLFRSIQVYRDTNGDNVWQLSDSPVITLSTYAFSNGYHALDFPTGDPLTAISPGETMTYFVVLNMQPAASQNYPQTFRLYYTPHQALLAQDLATQASVSVEESAQKLSSSTQAVAAPAETAAVSAFPSSIEADGVSTSTITATIMTAHGYAVLDGTVVTFTTSAGALPSSPYTATTTGGVANAMLTSSVTPGTAVITAAASPTVSDTATVDLLRVRASLRINDAPGAAGSEVTTHTMSADDALTVYVAAYDAGAQFINNPTDVTWEGTGIVDGNLSPTVGVSSTTFAPILVGTGTITVADGSGHADATDTITVTPGAVAAFTVTSPSPQVAGVPFSVTVTAYDADGNLKTDYAGLVSFESSDLAAVLPADNGSGWSGGASDFTLELRTTGVQTYSVADGSVTEESNGITVNPGALGSFGVTSPSPQVAGAPFSVTVTAYDGFSNLKTDYTGVISFTSSDGAAVLPVDGGSGWSGGASDFTLELRTTGVQTYSVADGAVAQESNGITVNPGALGSFGVTSPSPQAAGVPFSVTVTAYDEFSNPKTNYVGLISFASSDGAAVLPADNGSGWSDGVSDFTLELRTTGVQTYSVADGAVAQESNGITVNPGALGGFDVTSPSPQVAGVPFSVTVTAYDGFSNLKTDYEGLVSFASSDLAAVLPADNGSGWSDGVSDFTLELRTTGEQTYSVTDGAVAQESNGITVNPAGLDSITVSPAETTITASDVQTYTVEAFDAYDNSLGDVTASTVFSIVESGHGGSWADNVYTSNVSGKWTVSGIHSGEVATATLAVSTGVLHHFVFDTISSQIVNQAFTVTITAQDEHNNTVIIYNDVATLTDTTGTITPTTTGNFVAGVWTGDVTIMQAQDGVTITAQHASAFGLSDSFNVTSHTVFLPLVIRGD